MTWQELEQSDKELILEYDEKYDKASNEELRDLCINGDATALYELASRYFLGCDGVEQDHKRALELYWRVLQKQRHVGAVNRIGQLYEEGTAGEANASECVKFYEIGSHWGGDKATERLGLLYENGNFVEKNLDKAAELFQLSIYQGNKHAYFNLGDVYRKEEEYEKAKLCFEKAIEMAQEYYSYIFLGDFYADGMGVEKNEEKAFRMYQLAYEHGIKEDGAYYMGKMYFFGEGVSEDNAKAYQFFSEALELGTGEANYFLGLLNYLGEDENPVVEKNADIALQYLSAVPEGMQGKANERKGYICVKEGRIEEAKMYYEKAAALGNQQAVKALEKLNQTPADKHKEFMAYLMQANIEQLLEHYNRGVSEAAFLIARAYHYGEKGAVVDYEKAFSFYQKTIEQGGHGANNAYFDLALMYLDGKGVPQNTATAISYFEQTANKNFALSCTMLGEIYRRGKYAPIDMEKAVYWYTRGSELGQVTSEVCLAELYFQGKVGNKQELEKGIALLRSALDQEPEQYMACWYMANFLYTGVTENGKSIVSADIQLALKYFKIAAEGGYLEAYDKLGSIFSEPGSALYDYESAIKAYENGAQKGYVWSWAGLAMVHLLPEFRNEPLYNPNQGIQAAKQFLEKGDGSRGLKETVMELMMSYFDIKGEQEDFCRQEYLYLFSHLGNMGLAYTSEENRQKLTFLISEICRRITIMYCDDIVHGLDKIMELWTQLERICGKNSYIKNCAQGVLISNYTKLAEIHLSRQELEKAKQCFEKAAWNGSVEAEAQLRRFKTTMFGKLKFV